jgi:hypothetical protein
MFRNGRRDPVVNQAGNNGSEEKRIRSDYGLVIALTIVDPVAILH